MSIKLSDTHLVLLGAAAQRKDLCLVAPPTLKGAPAQKVASKLISAGFVKEVKAKASDPIWRRDEEKVSRSNPPFEIGGRWHVANSNLGNGILRPETFDRAAANEPQRRQNRLGRPTAASASRRNVVLSCGVGNHVGLRGLPGGAEGIRTDGHRGSESAR
jgi:hypothetical protein